jgi:hypothetical protein
VRAREAMVAVTAARHGEEDDRRGLRVGERGRGGWLGRPKAKGGPNGRGKGSGPAGVEGEVDHGWVESVAPKFKKKFLLNFN